MKVNEVSVTKSFTRNLGNFESARVEFGIAADPEGEPVDSVEQRLAAKVDQWLLEAIEEIDRDLKG